ncbi:MAG TPA: hypothetical protein PLT26_14825 [Anaerolineaceae bacterium]|nr:hypothetical protein [Anaerolineaceae bacterium]
MATDDGYGSAVGQLRDIPARAHSHNHSGTVVGLSPNRHLYADTRGALFPSSNPNQHAHDRGYTK